MYSMKSLHVHQRNLLQSEKDAQAELDRLADEVRAAHCSEEEVLIARLEAEEAERKRKEEARKRFQDIEDFKIGLGVNGGQ